MAQSIWKDYIVTLGTSSGPGIRFRINVDDAPIYEGKAFPRPGSTWVDVRINDICAEYLRAHFPNETPDYYSQEFEVEVYTDVWQREDIVTFIRDWSYDRQPPEGCDCIDDRLVVVNGLRILGLLRGEDIQFLHHGAHCLYIAACGLSPVVKELEGRLIPVAYHHHRALGVILLG